MLDLSSGGAKNTRPRAPQTRRGQPSVSGRPPTCGHSWRVVLALTAKTCRSGRKGTRQGTGGTKKEGCGPGRPLPSQPPTSREQRNYSAQRGAAPERWSLRRAQPAPRTGAFLPAAPTSCGAAPAPRTTSVRAPCARRRPWSRRPGRPQRAPLGPKSAPGSVTSPRPSPRRLPPPRRPPPSPRLHPPSSPRPLACSTTGRVRTPPRPS